MRRFSTAPKKLEESLSSSFLSSQPFISFIFLETDDSEEGIEMDNEDYKVATNGKLNLKSYEVEYESLSQTAVERLMHRDVDHICGILFVNVRVLTALYPLFLLTCINLSIVTSTSCERLLPPKKLFACA